MFGESQPNILIRNSFATFLIISSVLASRVGFFREKKSGKKFELFSGCYKTITCRQLKFQQRLIWAFFDKTDPIMKIDALVVIELDFN